MKLAERLATNLRQVRVLAEQRFLARQSRHAPPGCHHVVVPLRVLETYEETARGVVDALRAAGRPAFPHFVSTLQRVPARPGDRLIIYGGHRFPPLTPPPGVLYVGINAEQYPPDWSVHGTANRLVQKVDEFLACCHLVLDVNECLFAESTALGRPSQGVLPFGYTPRLDAGREPPATAAYDLAFLGRPGTGRRHAILERLGCRFSLSPVHRAWGRDRLQQLYSARIQLDLHQHDKPCLAGHRFALALANGCFVLSEPLPAGAPFQAGRHFVAAALEDFEDVIQHYLEHADERRQIAAAGRQFLREHYRIDQVVAGLLPCLDRAAAELAGSQPRA